VVNVATGRLVTVRQFVETAAQALQIPSDALKFGKIPNRREEMSHGEVSVCRLRDLLGWVPSTSIQDGIRDTVALLRVSGRGAVDG
jgi:nucleoside-diphosphate-sugar epimerase